MNQFWQSLNPENLGSGQKKQPDDKNAYRPAFVVCPAAIFLY